MIGVDCQWIVGLPTTTHRLDSDLLIQNHVDLLQGKFHAVPNCETVAAKDSDDDVQAVWGWNARRDSATG
jgi:hypothetical protein